MREVRGRFPCACGESQTFDGSGDRVECECGAVYVGVVTRLRPPSDAVGRDRGR